MLDSISKHGAQHGAAADAGLPMCLSLPQWPAPLLGRTHADHKRPMRTAAMA
jgi:hypothetical protein